MTILRNLMTTIGFPALSLRLAALQPPLPPFETRVRQARACPEICASNRLGVGKRIEMRANKTWRHSKYSKLPSGIRQWSWRLCHKSISHNATGLKENKQSKNTEKLKPLWNHQTIKVDTVSTPSTTHIQGCSEQATHPRYTSREMSYINTYIKTIIFTWIY